MQLEFVPSKHAQLADSVVCLECGLLDSRSYASFQPVLTKGETRTHNWSSSFVYRDPLYSRCTQGGCTAWSSGIARFRIRWGGYAATTQAARLAPR